ncbi:PLP-dependent aminotransferase family protein [Herbidospora sp. NBRC 101105]|uniref:MocR-like transcription factor YczR n=1 Tax=Herbidospora sp. NBRC 101105 TaxID=3032195 RepID=UPI0024A57D30|nr:PLP-dependent aminotransferase family protein [Herbidospora sp. NBRC 101105]GLX93066.1 GntR family transcriptional regulator [Herbidospora sp. NBRC 101105]
MTWGTRLSARALLPLLGEWHGSPAYAALAGRIRLLIGDGRITAGTRLPSERELAAALGRSRSTVVAAYQSLRDSGHLVSVHGSGSRAVLPRERRREVDFARAAPPPVEGLDELLARLAPCLTSALDGPAFDLLGNRALREAIADRYVRRGLATTPDQIVVTTGGQHAIALAAHTLVRRADHVLVESPTYPHACEALLRAGARPVVTPVTTAGWDTGQLVALLGQVRPALAYLIPDFHNPTGASMPPDDRVRVAEAARRAGTTLLIDETTADLSIDRPWDDGPFARHAHGADVVTIGSLSKSVWGGLRLGWLRTDASVVHRLVQARPAGDLGTPQLEQLLGERVVRALPGLLPRRAAQLRVNRDTLYDLLARHLPDWRVPRVDGGLSLWAGLDRPASSALAQLCQARGIALSAGPRFGIGGSHERFVRLPFTMAADDLDRGVRALAECWAQVGADVPGPGPVVV